jgi:hypothetical protein
MTDIIGSLLGGISGTGSPIGAAIVRLRLDSGDYQRELAAAEGQTKTSANTMGSGFAKFGTLANTALIGAAAGVVAFGVSSVKAFMESERAMAQTEAVLKSTGGAAGVTAQDVLGLAGRLRDLSGVDDEVIQASENLLLTFRDVRNEAGAGNDIFNQTERAILDMAVAMNNGAIPSLEEMNQTTIQVGKALNDPIRGMTALRRVGVTFNDTQTETITRLQESGDLMGAQKLILQELTKEFGGAAKAAGGTFQGQLAKLGSSFGDLQEAVGRLIVPLLTQLIPAMQDLVTVMQFAAGATDGFTKAVRDATISLAENELHVASWLERFGGHIPFIGEAVKLWDQYQQATSAGTKADTEHLGVVQTLSEFYRGRFADSLDQTTDQVVKFAHLTTKEIKEWSDDTKQSFDDFVGGLADLTTETEITRRDFIHAMRDMKQDARDLSRAMREISEEQWVPDEYIKFISEQGPEWLIGFARLTQEQQHIAVDAWEESTKRTDKAKESLDRITGVLKELDGGTSKHTVIIDYRYEGFDPSKPGMSAQQR